MDEGVLYLRLSKEDIDKMKKGDDSESIVNQRLLLTEYAVAHDINIVDVYSDDDYSGLYDDRPEFNRLIRDSKLGKFNVVIAKSQSRFTRNMEHMEKYLHHDFKLLGIRFIGLVDGADTNVKGNKKARQIYGLTNEWYCEDLSENIRAVFKQKMRSGQFLGSFAPYGYIKSPADKHLLIVDEKAAKVVKSIFDRYIQGYSVKRICNLMEDEGIPNPTVYKKQQGLAYANVKSTEYSQKYNLWSETTVKRILANETYIGKLIQGTCEKLSFKDRKIVAVPKEKWIVVENHHEPIVDKDVFYKVKNLRLKRRVTAPNQGNDKKVHMFAGKIRCETCGSTMIKSGGVRGKRGDWYLRCQLANKTRLKECTSHNILYSAIEKNILKEIQNLVLPILADKDNQQEMLEHIQNCNNTQLLIQEKQNKLKDSMEKLENQSKTVRLLYADRVNGVLTDDMFFQLKGEFENEISKIQLRNKELTYEIEALCEEKKSKKSAKELLDKYCDYSELTHEMVSDFIDSIKVSEKDLENNNQKITIYWNI